MRWGTDKRVRMLHSLLSKNGVEWKGGNAVLIELLQRAIKQMPDEVKDAMSRHYLEGGEQRKDPNTGKAVVQDSRYYQRLAEGRTAFITMLKSYRNDGEIFRKLENIYGQRQ